MMFSQLDDVLLPTEEEWRLCSNTKHACDGMLSEEIRLQDCVP